MAQDPNTAGADKQVWRDLFRDGRGMTTFILNLGVLLHAIVLLLISTVMPSVVEDIGGNRSTSLLHWAARSVIRSIAICGGVATPKASSRSRRTDSCTLVRMSHTVGILQA